MIDNKFIEDYVNLWHERQNIGATVEQQNLFSKKAYYELFKEVIDAISKHKDYTIEEIRNILYKNSKIEENINLFIKQRKMAPGLVFSFGTNNYKETIITGNKQEVLLDKNNKIIKENKTMQEDTIFDLASITKLFTSLSILKLLENKEINLFDEIVKYNQEFKNLKGITIFDLLTFSIPLKTSTRIDKASSKEEAEQILFNIEIDQESSNLKPYTDMGAMILKYVIEKVTKTSLYNFIYQNILKPLQMIDTYVTIPKHKIDRVASTNLDGKYYSNGNFIISHAPKPGIVFDPKARIMEQEKGNLSGHAGIFSTTNDMTTLAKAIINNQILDKKYIQELAKNRTGKKYEIDGKDKYVQYYGYLCYSKNPILDDSEVFHATSGRTFASAGWTGTQLTIDPLNELFFFMAANRSHNRMTFIDPIQNSKLKINKNGKKTIILPNGKEMIDSRRFAWDKNILIVNPSIKLAIQYKMLEDIYSLYNEKIKPKKIVRHI